MLVVMNRIDDLRSTLTDAGHTVVGFATLATKKAIEVRNDLLARTTLDDRLVERLDVAKDRAKQLVTTIESATAGLDARIDPLVDGVTGRLPKPAGAPVRQAVTELRKVRSEVRTRAHDLTMRVIDADLPLVSAKPASKGSSAAKATATKTARATAPKTSAPKNTRGPAAKAATPARRVATKAKAPAAPRRARRAA